MRGCERVSTVMACGIERKRERKIYGKHKHLKRLSGKKVYSINAKFRCHDSFSKLDACNRISGSAFRVSLRGMITLSENYRKQFRYLASFRQAKARFCHRTRESVSLNFPPSFLESTSINCYYIGRPKIFFKGKGGLREHSRSLFRDTFCISNRLLCSILSLLPCSVVEPNFGEIAAIKLSRAGAN